MLIVLFSSPSGFIIDENSNVPPVFNELSLSFLTLIMMDNNYAFYTNGSVSNFGTPNVSFGLGWVQVDYIL
ncbi:unnamed protein product [Rhizophagus irregularis]|uniref:Uncharacterized protein n=1 Tax=Rhizophagus irregularis TaxID=588596 RepID=A0A2I1HCS2_9GLOM|nr:hypothetical protein RhiirA4_477115 [Rhizophagus irregularis]CAB4423040.1 unnamed protein product [Rhizophagus irregularis]CAB4423226.1 unnamed protein product [Rhizophagus irregularis]